MIFIIVLLLVVALGLGYHRYMGVRAMAYRSIDVSGLTQDQIIDIGVRASTPAIKRMLARPQPYRTPEGDLAWSVGGRGGVMTFRVQPLPEGRGFRVGGAATEIRTAHMPGAADLKTDWGRAKHLTNWMCYVLHIPHNARQLLRRRRRAFHAIGRAGQLITPEPNDTGVQAPANSA